MRARRSEAANDDRPAREHGVGRDHTVAGRRDGGSNRGAVAATGPLRGRTALALAFLAAASGAARAEPAPENTPPEPRIDVVVAIDVSGSARAASGMDVDADGVVGINPKLDPRLDGQYPPDVVSTDANDSILAAELAAVRAFLETPRGADLRVALVAFSGVFDPATGRQLGLPQDNAQLVAPLAAERDAAHGALAEIARRGPHGGTDFSAAIHRAQTALCGHDARPDAERVLLLLTDGIPSLPFGYATRTDVADVSSAITAAQQAQACGVRIDVFAIGFLATSDPFAAKEVARVSGGRYYGIHQAADLSATLARALDALSAGGARSSDGPATR